ncbi:MAG: YggS family pyridoxal phosphate-dependent enzyme [Chitinophagaceae bacterium]|nr:YggS family pyridoxal phosphate-dependent enzyme [Chitinophagaceae bacterium]
MAVNEAIYKELTGSFSKKDVTLVAVSKTKPDEDIRALYDLGQRDFGENYVQEIIEKHARLPRDIRWHFIGHLQTNKVKYLAPFIYMIHGIDSFKLLKEVNKQASRCGRIIPVLLQVHIAREDTKFGLDENELKALLLQAGELGHIVIKGLMGMASFTSDAQAVRSEFRYLRSLYDQLLTTHHLPLTTLSMGMSGDYRIAVQEGSNMVRIGSLLFGARS